MVIDIDANLRLALEEQHEPGWVASAFYGAEETVSVVPLDTAGRLQFSADSRVEGRGTVYVARDADSSSSGLVPRSLTDPLAPNGQEIELKRTVTVGGVLLGSISLGRFRITEVPDSQEFFRRFPSLDPSDPSNSRDIVVGWACQLELQDRFEAIIADDFIEATGPRSGNSCYDELRRLSRYPIVESLPDQPVPAGTVYESRYDAIKTIATILGGAPSFTREGALTVRQQDTWLSATEPEFVIEGTISMSDGMSNQFFNQVQVTSSLPGNNLVGVARITDPLDPLAVTRPIGGRTYKEERPLGSKAQLDAAAARILSRVSRRQSRTVQVKCLPRPDLELGDFGLVRDPVSGREVLGEVSDMSFSLDPTDPMDLTIVAAETR